MKSLHLPSVHPTPDAKPKRQRVVRTVKISVPVLSPRKRATIETALKYGARLVAEFDGLMLTVTLQEDR